MPSTTVKPLITKDEQELAFKILRESGCFQFSRIRLMLREPQGVRDQYISAVMTGLLANKSSEVRHTDVIDEAFRIADSMMMKRMESVS